MNIKCYHVKHRRSFKTELLKAKEVADFAVNNKRKKFISTKEVKHLGIGLPSTIKCQILRKYGRGTIKKAANVNLIVPNSRGAKYKKKDGTEKVYWNIDYKSGIVTIKPLKLTFRWNPGKDFVKINQIEIDDKKFMISATFKNEIAEQEYPDVLGIDLNCGVGRHVANCANLKTGEVINLGKQGPNIRKMYFKKRKKQKGINGHKEKRKMKDLDHKISCKIVDYAFNNKLQIVVEDLKGIRNKSKKGKGSKKYLVRAKNRFVNSWSFFRLQSFIEYKAKERGIPYVKVNPHYTSQECSYCSVIGNRNSKSFICENKRCLSFRKERNADINAAFNVGKRSLQSGGRARQK